MTIELKKPCDGMICQHLITHIEDVRQTRSKNTENFRELYNSMSDIRVQLAQLNTHLDTLNEIAKLLQRGKGIAWLLTAMVGVVMIIPVILDLIERFRK